MIPTAIFLLVLFVITLTVAAYSTYGERKVAAFMQDRIGPNRAGPFGLFQPLADGGKMFMKEDFVPANANRTLYFLGPAVAMTTALITGVVIPWGGTLQFGDVSVSLQGINPEIGILFVFAMVGIGVYGIMLGGWASNNKYSLLGAIRAASQMVSYELAMGLSIVALVMMTGTLSLGGIVDYQVEHGWNIIRQPLGFLIFIVCAFAEANRAPFDMPECETELVGGYHTEFSSMKLGFYLFAEYVNMFISGAVMATLYFGGYDVPGLASTGWDPNLITIIGVAAMFAKTFFFIFFFMWIRWTLPRFRFDQLMNLGWKGLIPLAIVNILITGGIMLAQGQLAP
ncbi:MAG: NADH-quinone oxidoreductase subunit NuoH [Flavobacteriales bacterium]|jgi:NADH-quinone oxidoreductase subunit H|nr:NADH-quinone oxidoreductase subunit NuoH [Flavobacteriales bacterium]MBK6891991.1 NADH-quinone oxidoreductase subunit NuoH [Flavobacteriales bacterium]MBK7246129.1 NADH-quinone oxidoreductase subunit NuoH [Flavobacteriales bacterium]HQV39295.1 NADH-quinone oxidoreductase subunit NuoH [Flavobacteriales bacterium]HQW32820.1 NADH-quinone oxidoreductase subunit NuoH [Flavobacteriales bacterium]